MQGVRDQAWPPFDRRLWQRNFYEHIVRGEGGLERIRAYIADNPSQWHLDQLHSG
jgi:REP element-mobilizing transposase RayT